jgi:hypothetical protein
MLVSVGGEATGVVAVGAIAVIVPSLDTDTVASVGFVGVVYPAYGPVPAPVIEFPPQQARLKRFDQESQSITKPVSGSTTL